MHKDCPSVSSAPFMITSRRILGVTLQLYIAGIYSVGDNLHALFALVGRITSVTSLIFVVVKDDNFTEGVLNFVALFASLVSPLLEFGERYVLDLLPSLHPGAGLEHLVIVCVGVADMCDDSKLNTASQRELFGVTYTICTL